MLHATIPFTKFVPLTDNGIHFSSDSLNSVYYWTTRPFCPRSLNSVAVLTNDDELVFSVFFSIPLIPRRAGSPDVGSKSKLDKTKPVKGNQKDAAASDESFVTPDVDEKLLLEANVTACASVDKIVSVDFF